MAKSKFSTTENPHFDPHGRSPYELGYLLKKLPADFSPCRPQTKDAQLIAAAAEQHAANANSDLIFGLAALGKLMFVAGTSEQYSIDNNSLVNLGTFIEHIAVEIQFLQEIESTFQRELENLSKEPAKGGA